MSKHLKRVKIERDVGKDEQDEQDELMNGRTFRNEKILEDLEEEPSDHSSDNGPKKAKFILTHDEYSTPVATPTMDHKMDIFKFSVPRNSFEHRSVSAVVMANDQQQQYRTRKISTPFKDDQRYGTVTSFTTQLNSTPSLVLENNNSNMRLNRLNSNRMSSRSKGLKASPSTSSFQYISTPYHGK